MEERIFITKARKKNEISYFVALDIDGKVLVETSTNEGLDKLAQNLYYLAQEAGKKLSDEISGFSYLVPANLLLRKLPNGLTRLDTVEEIHNGDRDYFRRQLERIIELENTSILAQAVIKQKTTPVESSFAGDSAL